MHLTLQAPTGIQICLSPWMECMQSHVWNMACPNRFVTWAVAMFEPGHHQF